MASPDEQRLGPLRAGEEVFGDGVEGHASAEHALNLCVDGLHAHFGVRLIKDGEDRRADGPKPAPPVRPACARFLLQKAVLLRFMIYETLEKVFEVVV